MKEELTALDTATVEADWLRRLLNDLSVVEKTVPGILMNCDNQTVTTKVSSSKDNMKSSRHVQKVKVCQENEKLRSYCIGLYPNV